MSLTRRQFLRRGVSVGLTFSIVPSCVLGLRGQTPPSQKLNIACIGVGGRGGASVDGVRNENIVALCDVDQQRAASAYVKQPNARRFTDFRRMFDEMEKSIDAVTIATPDHTHAVAAMAAMKRRKHVFCEKPLAHSVGEIRALMKAAHDNKMVTQLGNQGHSSDTIRTFCEWIWDGAIGEVHTVHAVSAANHCRIQQLPRLEEQHEPPTSLDWDLWVGPAATRPYNPVYLPGSWRNWSAFGCGAIGDWICHVVDPSFWALDLGAPSTIRAEARDYDPAKHGETFPAGSVVHFEFPAKSKRGPVTLVWHDGVEKPPRPAEMEPDDKVPATGAIVMGTKGTIIHGSHGAGQVRIIPDAKMDAYARPAKTIPRVAGHHEDWLRAIKQGGQPGSNFDYGGPLTELALLGIIAIRLLGQKLEWDGAAMRFKNSAQANQYLNPPPRAGWAF